VGSKSVAPPQNSTASKRPLAFCMELRNAARIRDNYAGAHVQIDNWVFLTECSKTSVPVVMRSNPALYRRLG